MSRAEIAQQYADFFGEADGAVVHKLTDSVVQLYREWRLFLYFFCGPKERVDTLNHASGMTAFTLQRLLWENAILKVRTLTDPKKTRSNQNLSLERLVEIAERKGVTSIGVALDETRARAKPCMDYASKRIAHRDYDHALGHKVTTLTRSMASEGVEAIGDFMHQFHKDVRDVLYTFAPDMDAESEHRFLAFLHFGAMYEQDLRAREIEDLNRGRFFDSAEFWPEWACPDELEDTPFGLLHHAKS